MIGRTLLAATLLSLSPSLLGLSPSLLGLALSPPDSARLLAPFRAQNGPSVTVRGATRLEMESIKRVQGGVMLTVKLVDADLGEGVPNKKVNLTIFRDGVEIFRTTAKTSQTGSAQVFVRHHTGEYTLKLDFHGDPLYVAAKPKAQSVDLSKDILALTLASPPLVAYGGRPFPVVVTAKNEGAVANLHVKLQVQRGEKVIKVLRGLTGPDGQWRTALDPRALGKTGELLLVVTTPVTRRFNANRAVQRVTIFSQAKVTLSVSKKRARLGSAVTLRGTVRDGLGPVSGAIVRLTVGKVGLGASLTDGKGRFSRSVELRKVGLGRRLLRAHFVPRTRWRKAGSSPVVVLVVEPAKPIPMAYFLIPAGVTLLFLLAVLLVRKRPWEGLRKRLTKRQETLRAETGGIKLGKRRSFSSLFTVDHLSVSGTVVDLDRQEPLPGAQIYLRPAHTNQDPLVTATDSEGRFELGEDLTSGTYNLVITAPGWIPQSMMVNIPHRGELHGMLIRLQSVRVRVMQIYTDVVRYLLPDPELVRYWTPGESTRHVLNHTPSAPAGLSSLTALTQHVYYASEPPEVEAVSDAESLARKAKEAERQRKRDRDRVRDGDGK
jgi:Carboxypeptidase regulatory-like domain